MESSKFLAFSCVVRHSSCIDCSVHLFLKHNLFNKISILLEIQRPRPRNEWVNARDCSNCVSRSCSIWKKNCKQRLYLKIQQQKYYTFSNCLNVTLESSFCIFFLSSSVTDFNAGFAESFLCIPSNFSNFERCPSSEATAAIRIDHWFGSSLPLLVDALSSAVARWKSFGRCGTMGLSPRLKKVLLLLID